MYGGGHEVPANLAAARDWFRKAAWQGHAQACLMLRRFLADGVGGDRDVGQARQWLERAASMGVTEAGADLDTLRRHEVAPEHPAGDFVEAMGA